MSDLVVCSLEAWDDVWRRNQFLIAGLLERDTSLHVLFVEPPTDPVDDLRAHRRPRRGDGLRTVEELGGGRLLTYQPTKWLPRVVGRAADGWLRTALRQAVHRAGMVNPTLWINDPAWAELVPATGWPALYDITDDWLEAERTPRVHVRLEGWEDLLMHECREVVVCSPSLARSKSAACPVTLVQNAVDVARFRTVARRPDDLPDGPVAMYVGTLHEDRLDVELVRRTAEILASTVGGRFVCVGPDALSSQHRRVLAETPGVVVLGSRPNHLIPSYLQHATVLTVPHVVDSFTDSLDPIKMYEYQAIGRPIVSTAVSGFRDLRDRAGVDIVEPGAFPDAVARRAADGFAQSFFHDDVPDWSTRVDQVELVLSRVRGGSDYGP